MFVGASPVSLHTVSVSRFDHPLGLGSFEGHHYARNGNLCRVFRPFGHQPATLLEQITTLVGGLHLVLDDMRERCLHHLA